MYVSYECMKKVIFVIFFLWLLISPNDVLAQKKIVINLSEQRLYAYNGDNLVYNLLISSGKPWWPTPTGEFKPYAKILSQRMRGGNRNLGTYYDLPNVPNVVYFYEGYAIHGTYWHNNFGVPMSHGCVNVKTADMEKLYQWLDNSTLINITGITPKV